MMNTRDHLSFYARIKGIKDIRADVDHIIAQLDLAPHAQTLASKLSGGNKRKLSLAIALMGNPPVLVLDEPTSAMDAVAKRAFWRIIQEITLNRSLLLTVSFKYSQRSRTGYLTLHYRLIAWKKPTLSQPVQPSSLSVSLPLAPPKLFASATATSTMSTSSSPLRQPLHQQRCNVSGSGFSQHCQEPCSSVICSADKCASQSPAQAPWHRLLSCSRTQRRSMV